MSRVDRSSSAAGTLQRCVGDPQRFIEDVWGRRASHHPGADSGFDDLLTIEDVDHLLSSTALRTPMFRLVKDGRPLPPSSYTKSGRISSIPMTGLADPARIFRQFDQGATIVLQGMHRYWAPVARFVRGLEIGLGHPCQVNAYITPPGSRGLGVHHDSHDVFVLQAFGRKHWEVHAAPAAAPPEPPNHVELRPGDSLYMPRGTPHAARTQEALSGHITIGILATTWRHVLETATKRLLDDPQLDEPLPAGFHRDPERFVALVTGRLDELERRMEKADPTEIAEGVIERFLSTRPSLIPGGLVDLTRLADLSDDSLVRRRAGSICELRVHDGRLLVLLGDRTLRMPPWLEPTMGEIAARESFRVRDLADPPGSLDPGSRLVLARRLVREGLLEVPVER